MAKWMHDKFFCKSCIFKRKCVLSVTQSGSSNVLEVVKMWILEVFNEQMFYIKKISFHKKPNTWIKLSLRIKVRNVSEISIPFSIINSSPSQESHCSQMKPAASLLLQPLFLRNYLCSGQPPPVWVTITFLNLEFPCLSLTTQGQVRFI